MTDHLDTQQVRGIALTATAGLGREDEVRASGKPLEVPIGQGLLGRMFNVFGEAIDGRPIRKWCH